MRSPAEWLRDLLNANQYEPDYAPDERRTPYDDNMQIQAVRLPTIARDQMNNAAQVPDGPRIKTGGIPTGRVIRDGQVISRRIAAMLDWAQLKSGVRPTVTKGSFKEPSASSGDTHGGEAVDIRTWNITPTARERLLRAMKDAGFAAWYRPPGWDGKDGGPHIHALPIGGQLSPSAQRQVAAFLAGRNGLTNNASDLSYRPTPRVVFDYAAGRPIPRR